MTLSQADVFDRIDLFTKSELLLVTYLIDHPGWNRIAELLDGTNLKERKLRRDREYPGLRASASAKLSQAFGYCIIARSSSPKGMKLTNDPAEIRAAARSIERHLWSEHKDVEEYRKAADALKPRTETGQLAISFA